MSWNEDGVMWMMMSCKDDDVTVKDDVIVNYECHGRRMMSWKDDDVMVDDDITTRGCCWGDVIVRR